MKIKPTEIKESWKTGSLNPGLTVEDINTALGFGPNMDDDPIKVKYYWGFKARIPSFKKGKSEWVECAIWDYKGVRWSTFGPLTVFKTLFPKHC